MNLKPLFLLLCSGFLLTACGNDSGTAEGMETNTHEASVNVAAEAAAGRLDPICEMERDASWTDFSVYQGDTVWFCGEGCKQAFEARPEKYMGEKAKS